MIRVATIINTHALKGECKLYLVTDDPENRFAKNNTLYLKDGTLLKILKFRMQKGFGYCFFEGIDSIEKAETLKTKDLFVKKEDLPDLDEDTFYYHDLTDCKVVNEKEEELGIVTDILETGANLVLRVKNGKDSILIPFVEAFILDVDIENKQIKIHEMEGLR